MLYKIAAASALVFSADALRVRDRRANLDQMKSAAAKSGISQDRINEAPAAYTAALSAMGNDSSSTTTTGTISPVDKDTLCKNAAQGIAILKQLNIEGSKNVVAAHEKHCGKLNVPEDAKKLQSLLSGGDIGEYTELGMLMNRLNNGSAGDGSSDTNDHVSKILGGVSELLKKKEEAGPELGTWEGSEDYSFGTEDW